MAYRITDDCVRCGACYYECPGGAIIENENGYHIDPEKCTECGTCVFHGCPAWAIIKEE